MYFKFLFISRNHLKFIEKFSESRFGSGSSTLFILDLESKTEFYLVYTHYLGVFWDGWAGSGGGEGEEEHQGPPGAKQEHGDGAVQGEGGQVGAGSSRPQDRNQRVGEDTEWIQKKIKNYYLWGGYIVFVIQSAWSKKIKNKNICDAFSLYFFFVKQSDVYLICFIRR